MKTEEKKVEDFQPIETKDLKNSSKVAQYKLEIRGEQLQKQKQLILNNELGAAKRVREMML